MRRYLLALLIILSACSSIKRNINESQISNSKADFPFPNDLNFFAKEFKLPKRATASDTSETPEFKNFVSKLKLVANSEEIANLAASEIDLIEKNTYTPTEQLAVGDFLVFSRFRSIIPRLAFINEQLGLEQLSIFTGINFRKDRLQETFKSYLFEPLASSNLEPFKTILDFQKFLANEVLPTFKKNLINLRRDEIGPQSVSTVCFLFCVDSVNTVHQILSLEYQAMAQMYFFEAYSYEEFNFLLKEVDLFSSKSFNQDQVIRILASRYRDFLALRRDGEKWTKASLNLLRRSNQESRLNLDYLKQTPTEAIADFDEIIADSGFMVRDGQVQRRLVIGQFYTAPLWDLKNLLPTEFSKSKDKSAKSWNLGAYAQISDVKTNEDIPKTIQLLKEKYSGYIPFPLSMILK